MRVFNHEAKLILAFAVLLFSGVYGAAANAYQTQTIQSGRWAQISIPADPGPGGTVANLFGDDLPSAEYGQSWLIYVFNSAANQYRLVGLNEPLQANAGYWMFQRVRSSVELDIPDNLPAVSGSDTTGCINGRQCAIVPLTGSGSRDVWNMVGYSSESQFSFGDTRFVTASGPCASGCTPSQARAANVANDIMYSLNDDGSAYDVITESTSMSPWDGYWLLVLSDADQLRWVVPVGNSSGPQPPSGGPDPSPGPIQTPENGVGEDAYVNFESGHVRPIALSADGNKLYVVNTPNSTLDIFNVKDSGVTFAHSVPVGLEPVAVALRNSEAWVVNHLSDSVSVVDVSAFTPYVSKTLLVGDEPRDIVFAGQDNAFAFVTAAHRGQNGPDDTPIDAKLFTPSVGRADVWVFNANATGGSLGGNPIDKVNLFGDVPRALAVSEDGSSVYAAILHSGNRTATITENDFMKHGPTTSAEGIEQPDTGIIVQYNGTDWVDERGSTSDLLGRVYSEYVPFSLPDYDVFEIAADRNPRVTRRISGVGTTLFNMTVDPVSGDVFVTNTEALNLGRFEGEATQASVPTETLRSDFIKSRISIIDNMSNVAIRDLNRQLDFDRPATPQERATAVTQPLGMALTGNKLYVAAYASRSVAMYDIGQLRNNTFTNTVGSQAALSGGGPTGLVVDNARNRLYVVTRFNNSIAIVDTQSMTETGVVQMFNPEPKIIKAGREFMYDASRSSSHGTGSCGACHIFGDTDHLAWDLGNPDLLVEDNPGEFASPIVAVGDPKFHPLKGPMATQSLRGLPNTGALHWRGDRTGSDALPGETKERAAFREFNVTFPDLLGSATELSDGDMGRFADFALTMVYPPNPIRRLDNSLTPAQQRGRDDYLGNGNNANIFGIPFRIPSTAIVLECQTCHTLDPDRGFFGTSGQISMEGSDVSQEFKIPQLRNAYTKVGRFGSRTTILQTPFQGDQIRGYGYLHDGGIDTLDHFFQSNVFTGISNNTSRRTDIIEFVMAMDSNYKPVVGQQVTLSDTTGSDTDNRLNLLVARASLSDPECDLIAKGVVDGQPRGYLLSGSSFQSDSGESISSSALRSQVKSSGDPMTFTCVPPGSGRWMGIDRNNDGTLDGQ